MITLLCQLLKKALSYHSPHCHRGKRPTLTVRTKIIRETAWLVLRIFLSGLRRSAQQKIPTLRRSILIERYIRTSTKIGQFF